MSDQVLHHRLSVTVLLPFFATFITALHFWLVCVSSNELTHSAYRVLESGERLWLINLLSVFEVFFATALAGCLFVIFQSVQVEYRLFFLWFGIFATLSLVYDVVALCLAGFAAVRAKDRRAHDSARKYLELHGSWLLLDALYVSAVWTLFFLAGRYYIPHPNWFGIALLVVCCTGMILDTVVIHAPMYRGKPC